MIVFPYIITTPEIIITQRFRNVKAKVFVISLPFSQNSKVEF